MPDSDIREVEPSRFGGPVQRIHEADARLIIAGVVALLFAGLALVEIYGCLFQPITTGLGTNATTTHGYCHDIHDFKDLLEPFAGSVFTALGAAVAFYFADRRR